MRDPRSIGGSCSDAPERTSVVKFNTRPPMLGVPNRMPATVTRISIRPAMHADAAWIAAVLQDEWGGPIMWADGRAFDCRTLAGADRGP